MSIEGVKSYIKGVKALDAGDRAEAERLLAESLGIPELTPYMKENLPELLNSNDAAITLAIAKEKA